jgi:hypothetical protein
MDGEMAMQTRWTPEIPKRYVASSEILTSGA